MIQLNDVPKIFADTLGVFLNEYCKVNSITEDKLKEKLTLTRGDQSIVVTEQDKVVFSLSYKCAEVVTFDAVTDEKYTTTKGKCDQLNKVNKAA